MKNRIIITAIFLTHVSLLSGNSFSQGIGTMVLKNTAYYEEKYGDTAFTILTPQNWKFTGNITFGAPPVLPYNASINISNTDGSIGIIQVALGVRNIWATPSAGPVGQLLNSMQGQLYNGSMVQPPQSAEEYYYNNIHQYDVQRYPDFKVKSITKNVEIAQSVYRTAMKNADINALVSTGMAQVEYEVIEMRSEFTVAGKLIEGYSVMACEYLLNQNGTLTWGMSQGASFFAPRNQREDYESLFLTLAKSFTWNVNWLVKVQKHRAQLMQIALDVQDYTMKTYEAIRNNRSSREDMCFKNFTEAFRETSAYTDPHTEETRWLPNTWDNVWINTSGDVIMRDEVMIPYEQSEFNRLKWSKADKE